MIRQTTAASATYCTPDFQAIKDVLRVLQHYNVAFPGH